MNSTRPKNNITEERIIADGLINAGMGPAEASGKCRLFAQALNTLGEFSVRFSDKPYMLYVPGRIEVLGKHTDYAGGRSLLAALERGFCIAAAPRKDDRICIVDVSGGNRTNFTIGPELVPKSGHWSNYPMTVARRIARNFRGPLHGADIAFISDLPQASGMSSSSAMVVAIFKILSRMNGLTEREEYKANISSPEDLAGYMATIENGRSFGSLAGDRGVGTFGGSEDHTSICCCRPGMFHLYSFCPVRLEQAIAMPTGYILAIAVSGVMAEKTGVAMSRYNRASALVSALLELWQAETGRDDRCLADVVHIAADAPDRLRRIITRRPHARFDSRALLRRLEQFLNESERIVPSAAQALAHGEINVFGHLVDESQQLAEQLLENQVPQTIHLARYARECGAAAASAFGAGFGGSVWAMVSAERAGDFLAEWALRYRGQYPVEAERSCFFLSGAGPALIEL